MNSSTNLLVNHDFSHGLDSWHLNYCHGFVVSPNSGYNEGLSAKFGPYAVITNRKQHWQGLEQNITSKVSPGATSSVCACVGVSGSLQGSANVKATLRLEFQGSHTSYVVIGRTSVAKGQWKILEGKFSLTVMPNQVVFYLEGPSPGVDLLIKSAVITRCYFSEYKKVMEDMINTRSNLLLIHYFSQGLLSWHLNRCDAFIVSHKKDLKTLTSVSKGQWEKLEGTFSLSAMPDRVVFYLEGPPPASWSGPAHRISSYLISFLIIWKWLSSLVDLKDA